MSNVSESAVPAMFSYSGMTQIEYEFARTYVSAMRRDYYLLRGVLALMNPKDLGIKSVVEATNIAVKAAEMHKEFETHLADVTKDKKYHPKTISDAPPVSALADLFSLSFFTLAVQAKETKTPLNGFFSGEPAALADMMSHLVDSHKSLQKSSTAMQFLLLLKLFPKSSDYNDLFEFWGSVSDMFKYGSGLTHYGNYGQVYEDGYGDYEDVDDQYDEDDDDYDDYAEEDYD